MEIGRGKCLCLWWWSFLYLGFISILLYKLDQYQNLNPKVIIRKKKNPNLPLSFQSHDGTFKILQIADLHFGNGPLSRCRDFNYLSSSDFTHCSDLNSTHFLRRLIRTEKPDFIAFTGDNIFGSSATDAAESLIAAFSPVIESAIPWAAVLGNHDHESTMERSDLIFFISLLDYSLSRLNPSESESDTNIDGFGNFDVRVFGPRGSQLANTSVLDLIFLDSGDRETVGGVRTYGWIKESQLHWLSQRQKEKVEDVGLVFFHIPIPEMREFHNNNKNGNNNYEIVGEFQEWVASSIVESGVLRRLVSLGNVRGVFVGHDHKNDFCGKLEGIWFCYGGGFGYHGYGRPGWDRRARVISAQLAKGDSDWSHLQSITTWKRLDDQHLTKIDHQILWHPN